MNPDAWREHAACKGKPVRWFYAAKDDTDSNSYREARALCNACEVRPNCLHDALENWEEQGFRGGLTPKERRIARRTYKTRSSA